MSDQCLILGEEQLMNDCLVDCRMIDCYLTTGGTPWYSIATYCNEIGSKLETRHESVIRKFAMCSISLCSPAILSNESWLHQSCSCHAAMFCLFPHQVALLRKCEISCHSTSQAMASQPVSTSKIRMFLTDSPPIH